MNWPVRLVAVAALFVLIAPSAQADNPQISDPSSSVFVALEGANTTVDAASLAAGQFSTAATENGTDAAAAVLDREVPQDQALAILAAAGTAGSDAVRAGQGFAVVLITEGGNVATSKLSEANDTRDAAQTIGNAAIATAGTIVHTAVDAACHSPLAMPPNNTVCEDGSVAETANETAASVVDAAQDAAGSVSPASTLQAIRDFLNGVVDGLGDLIP